MKRRNLIRGVASSSLLALGVTGAAGQVANDDAGGATHLGIRQEDGSYKFVPTGGSAGPEYEKCHGDYCDAYCCSDCTYQGCACCQCHMC